jgi:ankyrin repeat protein
VRNVHGNTALYEAIKLTRLNFIPYLLKIGANTNAINENGNTALHLAF